jgi:23S rRNA (pseudouridine1915-N3)-methyltransferase
MKALVLSSAKLREASLVERFNYYSKLLRNRLPIEFVHLKKGIAKNHIPKGWRTIALDENGRQLSSVEFSREIANWMNQGLSGTAFLVGAADGLSEQEKSLADDTISLSRMTLPHQLCFVLLAEQLYRATSILRGESYHRE